MYVIGHRVSIAGGIRSIGVALGLCGMVHAGQTTVTLEGFTTGAFRWKDIGGNLYSAAYQAAYRYTQALVQVTYSTTGTVLRGTVTAGNLKPNFAYQLKLSGIPESHPEANENLGFSGRWWREEWNGAQWANGGNLNTKGDGSFPNPNDVWYMAHCGDPAAGSPTGLKYRFTGYRPFGYFITDANGGATVAFTMRDAYHVLFGNWQGGPGADDGPMKWHRFDPDPAVHPAYDTDYPATTKGVFGEWERLPKGKIGIAPGEYNLEFLLTEESFHESGLGGGWAHAVRGPARFTIIRPVEAADPAVLPPSKIARRSFVARWKWAEGGAPEGELSVASNAVFTQAVPGYEARYAVNCSECRVTNLVANRDYWYRVRRVMPDGSHRAWSPAMKIRTGRGMPVFTHLLCDVPVSKGICQEFAISNLVSGAGTLTVKSSNTNAVKAALSAGVLSLHYQWRGADTAQVTLTLKHPETGYKTAFRAVLNRATGSVAVVGTSALTNAGTRVAQEVTLENRTGGMVYGVRIRALGADPGEWLINRTGWDPVSQAAILEFPCVFPAGSQVKVRLVYHVAYRIQAMFSPAAYEARAIMTPLGKAFPVNRTMTIRQQDLYDGLWLLGLPANRNRLYTVEHSDDGGTAWMPSVPLIRATANYLMWLDTDEGAPAERIYRVVDAGM